MYYILNASSGDTLTRSGGRRLLPDRRRKVHFSLIKWLRYRKRRKKGTSRNVATWGSLCSHPFQRLFTLACPSPCFLFPAVYPCISDTMSSYFPKLGLARVATEEETEKEREREKERDHRAIPLVGAPIRD